jgi:hypothetical protein
MADLASTLSNQKKRGKMKAKTVSLGKKGSFKITHPGWTRNKAKAAGMSTKEWSEKHKSDPGVAGRRARAALGLMSMARSSK